MANVEKEMATHSSVLAWRLPGTAEPGGLPSVGSHRVRHDWSDLATAAAVANDVGQFFMCLFAIRGASQAALVIKNPHASAGDIREVGSVPRSGRSPGGWHGNPVRYSCLENPMDRGAWRATVHRVEQSWTLLKQLSMHTLPSVYLLESVCSNLLSIFHGVAFL